MGIRKSGETFAMTVPTLTVSGAATIAGVTTLAAQLLLADAGWAFASDAGYDSGFKRAGGLTQWIEDSNVLLTHNAAGTLAQASVPLYGGASTALQLEGDLQFINQPAAKTADYTWVQGYNAQFIIMNGANLNFNLPASAKVGALGLIKNINATPCTVVRNTGQTIDAVAANFTLAANAGMIITATGTLSWIVLATYAGAGAG